MPNDTPTEMDHAQDAEAYTPQAGDVIDHKTGAVIEVATDLPITFDTNKAAIEEMAGRCTLPAVKTKADLTKCKSYIKQWRDLRVAVEQRRKDQKDPALEYGRKVDKYATELKDAIKPHEEKLKKQKAEFEAAEKKRKEEEAKREQERVAKIEADIQLIRDQTNDPYAPIEELERRLKVLEKTEISELRFGELKAKAEAALFECTAQAKELLKKARARKAEEDRLAAEREKLEADKKAFEEQKAKEQAEEPHANVSSADTEKAMDEIRKNPTLDDAPAVAGKIEHHADPTTEPSKIAHHTIEQMTTPGATVSMDDIVADPGIAAADACPQEPLGKLALEHEDKLLGPKMMAVATLRGLALKAHGMLTQAAAAVADGDIRTLSEFYSADDLNKLADQLVVST